MAVERGTDAANISGSADGAGTGNRPVALGHAREGRQKWRVAAHRAGRAWHRWAPWRCAACLGTEQQAGEGGGGGEPAVRRAVIGRVYRLWHAWPAAGTPTVTGLTQTPGADPVFRDRFAAVSAPCTGGCVDLLAIWDSTIDAPPRTRQLDRARMIEKGQDRPRYRAGSPTVSVARTLTVSLHPAPRASSPATPTARAASDPSHEPPPSPRCLLFEPTASRAQHGAHRCHAALLVGQTDAGAWAASAANARTTRDFGSTSGCHWTPSAQRWSGSSIASTSSSSTLQPLATRPSPSTSTAW